MTKTLRFYLLIATILLLNSICLAQSNYTESLVISTYYPSPYGQYDNLRLLPSAEPSSVNQLSQPGIMFFNSTDNRLYIYSNITNKWEKAGADVGLWVNSGTNLNTTYKVGIGTSPAAGNSLEVNGRINVTGDVCITGGKCLSKT